MENKKKKALTAILIVAACVVVGAGTFFLFRGLQKNNNEPQTETQTEEVTEPTEPTTEEPTDVYVSFKNKNDIPKEIPEDTIIEKDGVYYAKYDDLVAAALNYEDYEFTFRDADNNKVTISVFNFLDSNTGRVSIATFTRSKQRKEVYKNLSLEQFRELTGSLSKDDVYEEGYETEYIPHETQETSVVTHTHDYRGYVEVAATCEKDGVYTFVCDGCGDKYSEPIKAKGHQFASQETKHATCIENGVMTYTCTECGFVKTESLPKTDHVWKDAVIYHVECSECGAMFSSEGDIEKAALDWEEHVKTSHNGKTDITAIPSMEEGTGEVCMYCGKKRQ